MRIIYIYNVKKTHGIIFQMIIVIKDYKNYELLTINYIITYKI